MIEDNLTPEQRIRLEATNQANMRLGPAMNRNPVQAVDDLLDAAQRISRFIETGERDDG